MADIEKSMDVVAWNDVKDKRYPNGGICDNCHNEAEYLHMYEEQVCRKCVMDINNRLNKNFELNGFFDGGCDFCGAYYQIESLFGRVKLDLCSNCFSKIALNSKRNNRKRLRFK